MKMKTCLTCRMPMILLLPFLALIACFAGYAQTTPAPQTPVVDAPKPNVGSSAAASTDLATFLREMGRQYASDRLPLLPMEDPQSITDLMDAQGDIRLTAAQAISLALRNNLDIAAARLLRPMAETDVRRASAGQLLRGIPTSNNAGPSSAPGPLPSANASGFQGIANGQPGILSDLSVQLAGAQIPRLDPVLYASGSIAETNQPLANAIVTGTNFLESHTNNWQAGFQKGFLLGTTIDASITSMRLSQNAPLDSINPSITANTELRIVQPLLQGFGTRVNSRVIHISKLNEKISDYTLRAQITLTITQVLTLYYDLIAFRQQYTLASDALTRSRATLADNKKRLDLGLISQQDYIESEAEADSDEQIAADAAAQIKQQEAIFKSVLTRRGLADAKILAAQIFPTDGFNLPKEETQTESLESVADRAIRQRVEVSRSELEMEISHLSLLGTRSAVLPTLNVYADFKSNGLSGRANPYLIPSEVQPPVTFVGGYGRAFAQIGAGNYPDYEVGFQLTVPLTNIAAKADNARAELALQQQQVQTQQLLNAVRLQAITSALALRQARRQYLASVKNRETRQANVATDQQMLSLGTATIAQLSSAQHLLDLAMRQEVTAENTYARAVINLESVLNETLDRHQIVIDNPGKASSATEPRFHEAGHEAGGHGR